MKRRPTLIAAGVTALALVGVGGAGLGHDQTSEAAGKPIPLAAATLIIEVNGTDGDAGLQFFLDGEPWNSMTISDPTGDVVVDVDAEGRLKDWGLTELFSESNEPPFTEVPLADFKARFPAGKYTFVGETIEGEKLVGTARLSHDIPVEPEITSPADGASVGRENVVARWTPAAQPAGIDRRLPGHRRAGGSAPRLPGRATGLGQGGSHSGGGPPVGDGVRARDPGDRRERKLDVRDELLLR
jgi:hypothetical protein